jgi:hypothetical protein
MATIISVGALLSIIGYSAANMVATPGLRLPMPSREIFPVGLPPSTAATKHLTSRLSSSPFWSGHSQWWALSAGMPRFPPRPRLFVYGMTCAALPMLRKKPPVQKGFHPTGGLVFAVLGVAFALVLVSRMGIAELIVLAVTTGVSFLNWLVVRRNTASTNS